MSFSNNHKFKLGQWVRNKDTDKCGKIVQISSGMGLNGEAHYFIISMIPSRNVAVTECNLEAITDEEVMLWKLRN